jgi:hypothetical protein
MDYIKAARLIQPLPSSNCNVSSLTSRVSIGIKLARRLLFQEDGTTQRHYHQAAKHSTNPHKQTHNGLLERSIKAHNAGDLTESDEGELCCAPILRAGLYRLYKVHVV